MKPNDLQKLIDKFAALTYYTQTDKPHIIIFG